MHPLRLTLFQTFQGFGEALPAQYLCRHPLGKAFDPLRRLLKEIMVRLPGVSVLMGCGLVHQLGDQSEEQKDFRLGSNPAIKP